MVHFGGFLFGGPRSSQKFGFKCKETVRFSSSNVSLRFRNNGNLSFSKGQICCQKMRKRSAGIFVKPPTAGIKIRGIKFLSL